VPYPVLTLSPHSVARFLDRTACSAPGAALIALYSFYQARAISGPSLLFLDHVKSVKWLRYLLTFVFAKTLNRSLTRLVVNHGWKADPPKWSRVKGQGDVVLITGGAAGIGKEFVDILAKKTDKIAVLDMAKPTYLASESIPNKRTNGADLSILGSGRECQVVRVRCYGP
jgi:all-trans-retinol dehydrogenase (NAD+)